MPKQAVESKLIIRPLGDRILVRRDKSETETPGGIILPDSVQAANKTRKGTVIAVGPGKKLEDVVEKAVPPSQYSTLKESVMMRVAQRLPMDVSVGDRIYFQQWAGNDVTNGRAKEEEDLIMLREEDVMGIIEQE